MPEPERRPPVIETPPIAARHGGRCHACRGAIRVDEEIQRVDRNWHHVECIPHNAVERWGHGQVAA